MDSDCHTLVCSSSCGQPRQHAHGDHFETRAHAAWSGDAEVAACMLRIKEIQGITKLEERRLVEQGSTERCRIVEEQRSRRLERMASAQENSAAEQARTRIVIAASRDRLEREALAVKERLEVHRVQLGLGSGWVGWRTSVALGALTLAGLIGLLAPPRQRVLGRRSSRQVCALLVVVCSTLQLCRHAIYGFTGNQVLQGFSGADSPHKTQVRAVETTSASGRPQAQEITRASRPGLLLPSLDPDAAAGLGGSAGTNGIDRNEALAESRTLREFLVTYGLEMYSEALAERGYDEEVICVLSAQEAEEMFEAISCKPGHRVRFRRLFYSMQSVSSDRRGTW